MKAAVIFWSGTGNTETMAQAVKDGLGIAGVEADLLQFSDITPDDALAKYDLLALGCPAMGGEQLEEGEVEPFFTELEGKLKGRKLALFGSYGWGDGQWMRDWAERALAAGAVLAAGEGLIANEAPDDEALNACQDLGQDLARL
jgi:flavodoxin short chain